MPEGIPPAVVGLELPCVPDLNNTVATAAADGFAFVIVPLVHPRYVRSTGGDGSGPRALPFTRTDALLSTNADWSRRILGRVTPLLDVDSPVEAVRKESAAAFLQEVHWAAHLSVTAVLMPTPLRPDSLANYAALLSRALGILRCSQVWVRIPMDMPMPADADPDAKGAHGRPLYDAWEMWNALRTMCEHHPNLHVALEVSGNLPDAPALNRWLGEPLKAIILPSSIYLTNAKGFPVLSKAHQELVKRIMRRGSMHFVVTGHLEGTVYRAQTFPRYLAHLNDQVTPLTDGELSVLGYEDALQMPLQPLMDNLDSGTYEVFERDTIKYDLYEEAIRRALLDRPADTADSPPTVVMVVGAGRGPLVKRSLKAAETAKRRVRVYAVEKNPFALVTLQALKDEEWGDRVTVVASDMRVWQAPEQADILVSELLGSFGDNELSPECLDGAQRVLKDGGVSIPQKYTSYLALLSSSTLFNAVKAQLDASLASFEKPYVTRLHNVCRLSDFKPVFTFEHPNRDVVIDNTRYVCLDFEAEQSGMLHGFAGYFDSNLYKDVLCSILPTTHSPEMYSWFPIFFPLRTPQYVARGTRVQLHMWRRVGDGKVWYEWSLTSPQVTPIHNPGGRSYWIGL